MGETDQDEDKWGTKLRAWELLILHDCALLAAICKLPQIANGTTPAMALIVLLRHSNRAEMLVKKMIKFRIHALALTQSNDMTNVLRDNSMTVLLLSAFAKIEGNSFLLDTLKDGFNTVFSVIDRIEINPRLIEPEDVQGNMDRLVNGIDRLLGPLYAAQEDFPGSFKRICCLLRNECETRLKETPLAEEDVLNGSLRLVGSFLFLRYICAAIATPNVYRLTLQTEFGKEERRGLILLGKVLNAVGQESEVGVKEEYMQPVNQRIAPHRERMRQLLLYLSQDSGEGEGDGGDLSLPRQFATEPPFVGYNDSALLAPEACLDSVLVFFQLHQTKIATTLEQYDPDLMEEYRQLLDVIESIDYPKDMITPKSRISEDRLSLRRAQSKHVTSSTEKQVNTQPEEGGKDCCTIC
eukprot:Lithocolla_globosa_v1_NODE_4617_length_1399_cov_16.956101.p1 type:complete len:410 gc:universal NODE_4617_length_1399_cov_16.956101:1308-79(-)